jgi:hypothetical protein
VLCKFVGAVWSGKYLNVKGNEVGEEWGMARTGY